MGNGSKHLKRQQICRKECWRIPLIAMTAESKRAEKDITVDPVMDMLNM